MGGERMTIRNVPFMVADRPYCVWSWDIDERNAELLRGIDPWYFKHLALMYAEFLQTDENQYASIGLRTAYHHSLETLFALICATLQAPHCVLGWLLKYRTSDLYELVRKISAGEQIISLLDLRGTSWQSISKLINRSGTGDPQKSHHMAELFGGLWSRLAEDFLNETYSVEYNSIKHGMRVSLGGFWVSMGKEETAGVPPPRDRMAALGGSEFGVSFFKPSNLHNSSNFWLRRHLLNWAPGNLVRALHLISMSLNNILAFLRVQNRVDAEGLGLVGPDDETYFAGPWLETPGVLSSSIDMLVEEADVENLPPAEIRARYELLRDRLRERHQEGPSYCA